MFDLFGMIREKGVKMISKELLSEVLNKNISSYEFDMYGNIDYKVINDYGSNINIYELSHKCKEWALDNGYTLSSNLNNENDKKHKDGKAVIFFPDNETYPEIFDEGTEYEAIFKACQWILDNKED